MPTANDFFPSKFLKAEDFEADVTYTMKKLTKELLKGKPGKDDELKPVLFFEEVEKGLIVNKTNWAAIEKATGEADSDHWTGKKVTLTIVEVDAFGDIVKAIRVKDAKTSDPTVQKYWQTCSDMRLTVEEGRAHLKEFKGDFAGALAGLLGDDNTPNMDQLPPK
jgi:hypothetical protein